MSVRLRLAEPVVFLYNLDSATDRRERRRQRQRASQEASTAQDGPIRRQGYGGPAVGAFGAADTSPAGMFTYAATTGRGGAGARSQSRGRSLTPSRRPEDSRSRSASRRPSRDATPEGSGRPRDSDRVVPDEAHIDYVRPPAVLRGVLSFTITKPTRIKKIGVRLKGQSRTEWPEGIGPRRLDTLDRTTLIDKQVLFYDASVQNNTRRAVSTAPQRNSFSPSASRHIAERASSVMPYAAGTFNTNMLEAERPGTLRSLSLSHPQRTITRAGIQGESSRPSVDRAATSPVPASSSHSPPPLTERAGSPSQVLESDTSPLRAGRSSDTNGTRSDGSRASSLHDRLQQENHLQDGTSSEGPSILTYEESEAVQHASHPEEYLQSDQHTGHPLGLVQTNVSRASVSTTSDQDERGRSLGPARRFRTNGADSHQHDQSGNQDIGFPATARTSQAPESALAASNISASPIGRGASPAPSALRNPSIGPRSPSSAGRGDKSKSARFSLSSLVRGMSTTRTDRQASPERQRPVSSTRTGESTSRGRASGLKAIKNAFTVHHNKTSPGASDSDEDSDDEEHDRGRVRPSGWQEFKPGTYNYPIHIPLPNSLPPTIHADHGMVTYMLKGFVNRAGALSPNLKTVSEVHVVAAPNEDDLESVESIIVDRMWETQLSYKITIHCKSATVGGEIPVSIRLNPLAKMRMFRLTALLEENWSFYAKDRKIIRSPPARKFEMLKIQSSDGSALLPIVSEEADALQSSPLGSWIVDSGSSEDVGVTSLDPLGPWHLAGTIKVPDCNKTLHFSTTHEAANISVIHTLKILLRVERGDDEALDAKGNRKRFDIIIEAPMHILSCRTSAATYLPTYARSAPSQSMSLHTSTGEVPFHPHELSEVERASQYIRTGASHTIITSANGNAAPPLRSGVNASSNSGISDQVLQDSILLSSNRGAVANPPPTYQDALVRPDQVVRV